MTRLGRPRAAFAAAAVGAALGTVVLTAGTASASSAIEYGLVAHPQAAVHPQGISGGGAHGVVTPQGISGSGQHGVVSPDGIEGTGAHGIVVPQGIQGTGKHGVGTGISPQGIEGSGR